MQRDLSPPPFAFKCRDCGVEVDDPETHKCNPAEILPPAQRKSIRPVNDRQTIFAPSFRLRDLASPTLAPFTTIERNRDTIIADNVDEDKYSSTSSSRRRYDDDYDSRGRSNKYESPRSKYDDYNSRKSDRSRERYDDYGERRDRRTYDDDRSSVSQRSRDDKYDNRSYDDRGSYNSKVEDKYGAHNRKPNMDDDSYGMSSSALRHKSSSSTSSNKFNYTSSRQSQPQRYRSRSPSPYSSVDSKRPSASQQLSDEPTQNIPPSTQEADEPKKKFGLDFLANYTKAFFGGSTTQSDGIETEESNHDSSPQSHSTNISADSGYVTSNVDNRSSLSSRGYDRRNSKKSLEQFDDIMSELSREMGESSVDDYPVKNSRGRTDNYRDPVPSQSPVPVSLIKIYSSSEKIVCPGCKGLIWRGDDIVSIPASSSFDDETIYHSTCLVCAVCSVSQDRDIERFVVHRGEVYCSIDWKEVGMDKDIDLNKEPRQNLQDDRSRYGRDNDDRRYDSSPKYRDDYDQPKDLYNRNDPNAGYYGSKYDDSERATSRDVGRTSRGRSVDETACATWYVLV
ncbi:hypothetical protein BKA69DRAFT_1040250 [Paraphysoderma sedebokerense]|nr:hypothetical protein BKA69DRAFT_1040250 [Paraphysoderma sedebokerense]